MSDDVINDEIELMFGGEEDSTLMSCETFKRPIKELHLPKTHTIPHDASIEDAITTMKKYRQSAVAIVQNEKLVGIFTEQDVVHKVVGIISDLKGTPITKVMATNPLRLREQDCIAFVMHHMHLSNYRHIPVIDDKEMPLHIISLRHINAFIADHFPKAIINIPNFPFKGVSKRDDG